MTFDKLKSLFEKKLGVDKLADIARELKVTPQVISNWKARNQVPYKYVKVLRSKIKETKHQNDFSVQENYFSRSTNIDMMENSHLPLVFYLGSVLTKIFHNIKFIFSFCSVSVLLCLVFLKFFDVPVYVSTATILPTSGGNSPSGLAGIQGVAEKFGFSQGVQSQQNLTSSVLVPDIIKSKHLSSKLLKDKFLTNKHGEKLSLSSIVLGFDKEKTNLSLAQKIVAKNQVRKMISVISRPTSPLLKIRVKTFEPGLAKVVTDSIIKKLDLVLVDFKNANLNEKKRFIKKRISEVSMDLEKAENNLKVFRERNRKIISSPNLMLAQERLLRDLEVKTQVYITVKTELEMVQIEEIGQSKMVQVLDFPDIPIKRNDPRPIEMLFATILLSLIFSLAIVYLKDWVLHNKSDLFDFGLEK